MCVCGGDKGWGGGSLSPSTLGQLELSSCTSGLGLWLRNGTPWQRHGGARGVVAGTIRDGVPLPKPRLGTWGGFEVRYCRWACPPSGKYDERQPWRKKIDRMVATVGVATQSGVNRKSWCVRRSSRDIACIVVVSTDHLLDVRGPSSRIATSSLMPRHG